MWVKENTKSFCTRLSYTKTQLIYHPRVTCAKLIEIFCQDYKIIFPYFNVWLKFIGHILSINHKLIPYGLNLHIIISPLTNFINTVVQKHLLRRPKRSGRQFHPHLRRIQRRLIDSLDLTRRESNPNGTLTTVLSNRFPETQCCFLSCKLNVFRFRAGWPRESVHELGEVEMGPTTSPEVQCGHVVGRGGHLGGLVAPEPDSRFGSRLPNFGHPLAPFSHSDASESRLLGDDLISFHGVV